MYDSSRRSSIANRVTAYGSLINLFLMVFKLLAGIYGKSAAMVADAVHSMSDFATDIVVIVSLCITKKPRDKSHDYGHGKFETLASLIIGFALLAAGTGIGFSGIKRIILFMNGGSINRPGGIALAAALISIIVKELLYRWTINTGKKINSQAVIANAWHHRSDALSSIGTFIGIGGAILLGKNWVILDPVAGIVVSYFIIKIGIEIGFGSINELLEASLSDAQEDEIIDIISSVEHVQNPHNLKTRKIGNDISIDVHIRLDRNMNIVEGHEITRVLENRLRDKYGAGTFISIHIEPVKNV